MTTFLFILQTAVVILAATLAHIEGWAPFHVGVLVLCVASWVYALHCWLNE